MAEVKNNIIASRHPQSDTVVGVKKMEFNGTFLITIISFLVFVFLMNKILYEPILSIMEKRKKFIDENYKNAEENDTKSEQLNAEKDEKLNNAKNDAKEQYLNTVDDYKSQKANIIQEAQEKADNDFKWFKGELDALSNDAKNNLKSKMNELAGDISEKILGYRTEVQNIDDEAVNQVLWQD